MTLSCLSCILFLVHKRLKWITLCVFERNTFVSETRNIYLKNGCSHAIVRDLNIYLWCCFRVQWPQHTTLLYMTPPIWKQTMCSNWRTSCVTCTTIGLALSEFLLLARWVLCETQAVDKNACNISGFVKWNNRQTNDTSTQCIFVDVKRQLHVLTINGSHHQTACKRN